MVTTGGGGACREWRDIGYVAFAEEGSGHVNFQIYEIEGFMENGKVLFHQAGSFFHPDGVDVAEEADVFAHGYVKWDGCSNWDIDENSRCMLHGCERVDLVAWGEMLARCWDWADEIMGIDSAGKSSLGPDWGAAKKTHDWRNHVGEEVRHIWPTFTPSQQQALVREYQRRADQEVWE